MYVNKRALVVGIARSGIGAANLLNKLGAVVTINDIKSADKLKDQLQTIDKGINIVLNQKADELVPKNDIVIVSPGIPTNLSFFAVANDKNIPVISEIELAYSVCSGQIAAITGTNGKTTTTALVGEIFKKAKRDTCVAGNIGDAFSNEVLRLNKDSAIVLEVSSFQMETINEFRPKIAAVLNITQDHLARHGSMDEYIRAKKRIFENQTCDDILILNYDDETTKAMSSQAKAKIIYFSKNNVDLDGVCVVNGEITIKDGNSIISVCKASQVSLPGMHNLENILAAVAISYYYGIDVEAIRSVIQSFAGIEHRLEFVANINGIKYINDSKGTNIDATICAIKSMDKPTIIVLGGYDKGAQFNELVSTFNEYIVGAVVIGETTDKIVSALKNNNYSDYRTCKTYSDAIYTAKDMANDGYNILLSPACASFDMFDDYEARGKEFKNIVKSIAEGKNG